MEQRVLEMTQQIGIGAQFGGKYFCHDVRVIRLPRHGASLPIGIGVSCSADRQIKAKITKDGIFLEQLETDPAKVSAGDHHRASWRGEVVAIDLNKPMAEILATLSQYPIKTRVALTGTIVVARDIAHAKLKERLDRGEGMPDYMKNHPVYYAGPAKTPEGMVTGSFGPTTAGRMDSYVDEFQAGGRLAGHAGEGQPEQGRARCVQGAWRVLPGLDRRAGRRARAEQHHQGRSSGVSGAGDGSRVENRGQGFPRSLWWTIKAMIFLRDLPDEVHSRPDRPYRFDMPGIQRDRRWYQRVLGMEREEYGGSNRTALRFGAQKINLHEVGHEVVPHSKIAQPGTLDLCFVIAVRPEDAVAQLRACGIPSSADPCRASARWAISCRSIAGTRMAT